MSQSHIIHYAEYYPHYMGTTAHTTKINIHDMDEIFDLTKNPETEDDAYDRLEIELASNCYALSEILRDWPKIRTQLEKKGEWSGEWEEGSHAISMTNFSDAKKLVAKIEAQHIEDEF